MINNKNNASVLVIDDNPFVLNALGPLLREHGFHTFVQSNALEAIDILSDIHIDVVLTDIKMPKISGLELLEKMLSLYPEMPIILMTAHAKLDIAVKAIRKGAFDFIIKPFIPEHLINTLKKAAEQSRLKKAEKNYKSELESIVQSRTRELKLALSEMSNMSRDIIQRFTRVSEYRDTCTGDHISRIGLYSNKLAETLNMPGDFVSNITFASSMHDIGKIGIPDSILLKPGKLTPLEFAIMKKHTTIGGNILEGSSQPLIEMAKSIALNHHEKWDSSGYPVGLKGEDIPIEGMIVMVADQYDALRSKRPYKSSVNHESAFKIITKGGGSTRVKHFNPDVLNAFIKIAPVFNEIFETRSTRYGPGRTDTYDTQSI